MGEVVIGSRWDLICQSLMTDIGSSKDLEVTCFIFSSIKLKIL